LASSKLHVGEGPDAELASALTRVDPSGDNCGNATRPCPGLDGMAGLA